jgi:hypothetical protein
MKNLKKTFWRAYYRLTLGAEESSRRAKSAESFGRYLAQQSDTIGIGRNYDVNGNQIRGWHKPTARIVRIDNSHPLIEKYCR